MSDPPVTFSLRVEGLDAMVRRLRREEDGDRLHADLARELYAALEPAAVQARSGIMAMSSAGLGTSPGLRSTIAAHIQPEIRLGGTWAGARVRATRTPGVRRFANAPKRTQNPRGWRTQIYGTGRWRTQRGRPNWFDRAMQGRADSYRRAAEQAMDAMARRLAD